MGRGSPGGQAGAGAALEGGAGRQPNSSTLPPEPVPVTATASFLAHLHPVTPAQGAHTRDPGLQWSGLALLLSGQDRHRAGVIRRKWREGE